ncbi:Transient receptor potential cation channel subfamily M member-like 2 [Lamellibrachia satsuma]|nr:Transient receptor potential cation channel subfamily M member-like 2 [Lamellibrachia satsuma]
MIFPIDLITLSLALCAATAWLPGHGREVFANNRAIFNWTEHRYMAKDNRIPVVSVVIGGGHGTIETVHDAIECGTPAVIIEGSGRAADILARAYKKSMEESDDQSLQEYVDGMLNEEFPKEESKKSAVQLVMYCLQNKDHMNVLQLDSSDSAREIDELILQALRKVNKNSGVDMMQLKLALAWKRIDAAKSLPSKLVLDDLMVTAIQNDQADFVKLFMTVENGIHFCDFLTPDRIRDFYAKLENTENNMEDDQGALQDGF